MSNVKNKILGSNLYVFVIDLQGHFHCLKNTITSYRGGSLYIVDEWNNEGKNLNLPCRYYAQAEYSLFPQRGVETMTSNVRMFGRDLEKLKFQWKMKWLEYVKKCNNLSEKFLYFENLVEMVENDVEN